MIYESFFHLRSAHGNVRKYVGIPNCLNKASTSYKYCFQYAGIYLTELTNKNALSLAANLSIVPLTLFLTISAVSVLGLKPRE